MKQIDNRQKQVQQLKAQKGHLLPFRDKSHIHSEDQHSSSPGSKKESAQSDATPHSPEVHTEPKVGRNDPCPCGSGKKYKKCCLGTETQQKTNE